MILLLLVSWGWYILNINVATSSETQARKAFRKLTSRRKIKIWNRCLNMQKVLQEGNLCSVHYLQVNMYSLIHISSTCYDAAYSCPRLSKLRTVSATLKIIILHIFLAEFLLDIKIFKTYIMDSSNIFWMLSRFSFYI